MKEMLIKQVHAHAHLIMQIPRAQILIGKKAVFAFAVNKKRTIEFFTINLNNSVVFFFNFLKYFNKIQNKKLILKNEYPFYNSNYAYCF